MEIVVTIAVLAIVAGLGFVAYNPAGQVAAARNRQRELHLQAIMIAIRQNTADSIGGQFSCAAGIIPASTTRMSSSGYNIDNGYGRTEKDIILYGVKGTDYSGTKYVVHYNGTDFTLLLTTINQIGATVITNNSVFIVTETKEYKWIIIKGTLKS